MRSLKLDGYAHHENPQGGKVTRPPENRHEVVTLQDLRANNPSPKPKTSSTLAKVKTGLEYAEKGLSLGSKGYDMLHKLKLA